MIFTCKFCYREFKSIIKNNKNIYCSLKCKRNGIFKWNTASEEDIKNRLLFFFLKKVIKYEKGCWGWNGGIDRNGYGYMSFFKKNLYAHRASWIITNGFIPIGKSVLHKCDNPICSNINHLFLGTQKDNMLDMFLKNRSRLDNRRKFKKEEILNIRKLLNEGETLRHIAKIYNVSHAIIGEIKLRKTYKDY